MRLPVRLTHVMIGIVAYRLDDMSTMSDKTPDNTHDDQTNDINLDPLTNLALLWSHRLHCCYRLHLFRCLLRYRQVWCRYLRYLGPSTRPAH